MELFITILQLICGLIVIGIVLFQRGKSAVIFRAYSTNCNRKELPKPRFGSSFFLSHAIRLSSSGRM